MKNVYLIELAISKFFEEVGQQHNRSRRQKEQTENEWALRAKSLFVGSRIAGCQYILEGLI